MRLDILLREIHVAHTKPSKNFFPISMPRKRVVAFVENALAMVVINPVYSTRGPRSLALRNNSMK